MATKQHSIVQEIISRLDSGLPTAEPPLLPPADLKPAHRSVSRPLDEEDLPTFAVMVVENSEDDTSPERPAELVFRRCLWVWIEARALGDPADPDGAVDITMDPYVDYVMSVLLSDEQLGGLVDRIEPDRVMYEGWEGRRVYGTAAMLFRLYYLAEPI